MKLCWDNLNNIHVTKKLGNYCPGGKLGFYEGVVNYKMLSYYVEFANYCDYCGLPFIKKVGAKTNYCDKECRHLHFSWKKEWKKLQKQNYKQNYPKRYHKKHVHTEKTLEKMSNMMKERWQTNETFRKNVLAATQKTNTKRKSKWPKFASYDVPSLEIMKQHEEVRRDPERPELMQVKCGIPNCENWINPSKGLYQKRLGTIRGDKAKKRTRFVCKRCIQERRNHNQDGKIEKKRKQEKKKLECAKQKRQKRLLRNKKKWGILHRKEYRKIIKKFKLLKKQIEKDEQRKRKLLNKQSKNYRKQQTEYVKQRRNKLKENDPKKFKLKKLFYYSKVRAKEKKLEHTLTYSWLEEKCKNNICEATGKTFDYDPDYHRNPYGPSIDRTDISKGYTEDNCRIVIWAYNCGKAHYTDGDLYKMCRAFIKQHDRDR